MRLFACQNCGATLFFENTACGRCGLPLGYLPDLATMSALRPAGQGWAAMAEPERTYRWCANALHGACNWLVAERSGQTFCAACRHNRIIPDLSIPLGLERWRKLELAKHRLIYSLIRLGIELPDRIDDPARGLVFDFLDDRPEQPVMTGHDNGLITIAAREADDAIREERRNAMQETYRTLLGHFRHEVGHWIWGRLVRDGGRLDECRSLFGDDRADYRAALVRHYREGAPGDWQAGFITAYATSHPWEDFAETWAHYLHIVDTLETADAFGLGLQPGGSIPSLETGGLDPYTADRIEPIIEAWLPLVLAVNSLNRSMGLADLYPFVISEPVIGKLAFMHRIARARDAA